MVKILVGNYHVDIQIDQVVGGNGNLTWENDPHEWNGRKREVVGCDKDKCILYCDKDSVQSDRTMGK
jgi:hypothetical protein